jgi:hypothetical protein
LAGATRRLPSQNVLLYLDVSGNFKNSTVAGCSAVGEALATLTALTCLVLDRVPVARSGKGSILAHLAGLHSLEASSARRCKLSQSISVDVLIEHLMALTALMRFDVRENYWQQQAAVDRLAAAFSALVSLKMVREAKRDPEEDKAFLIAHMEHMRQQLAHMHMLGPVALSEDDGGCDHEDSEDGWDDDGDWAM